MLSRLRTGIDGRGRRIGSGPRSSREFALGLLLLLPLVALLGGCGGRMPADLAAGRGRFAPCPASPNCVHSEAPDDLHRIDALRLRTDADPDAAWRAVVDLLGGHSNGDPNGDGDSDQSDDAPGRLPGRERVEIASSELDYVHAVFTTPVMRYRDDVELALDRDARVIRVRSASRVGYGDMGANRERLEAIRKALAERALVEPADGTDAGR